MEKLASNFLEQFTAADISSLLQKPASRDPVLEFVGFAALGTDLPLRFRSGQLEAAKGNRRIVNSAGSGFAKEHVLGMNDHALQQSHGRLQLLLLQQFTGLEQPLSQPSVGDVQHPGRTLGRTLQPGSRTWSNLDHHLCRQVGRDNVQ